MEKIIIQCNTHYIPAKVLGSISNKWNRAAKLMSRFDELDFKYRGMVLRGGTSERGRLALACLLLMHTGIRVGNEGSAEGYMTKPHPKSPKAPEFVKTYGLTTLLPEHLTIRARKAKFAFVGKKCVENFFEVADPELVSALDVLKEQAQFGLTLFGLTDYMLTKFIKRSVGRGFSPKDFRCMRAHIEVSQYIQTAFKAQYERKADLKADLKALFVHVSEKLNNLPNTAKKSYCTPDWPAHLTKTRLKPKKPVKRP